MKNSVWCFVGGWPCIMHPAHIQSSDKIDIRRMTEQEVEAMRRIGYASREKITEEAARQQQG